LSEFSVLVRTVACALGQNTKGFLGYSFGWKCVPALSDATLILSRLYKFEFISNVLAVKDLLRDLSPMTKNEQTVQEFTLLRF
jgi:hypothetical protein